MDRVGTAALIARTNIADVIGRYVKLTKAGREYKACCPFHEERSPSFYVIPDKNFAYCFGCGWCDDVIGFVRDYLDIGFKEAVAMIDLNALPEHKGPAPIPKGAPPSAEWQAVLPVPDNAPPMDPAQLWNPKRDETTEFRPSHEWAYRDADGRLLGYVLRIDMEEGRKITPTVTYAANIHTGEMRWSIVPFTAPRPLYGLDALAERPDARVLLVEGEKCRDAAAEVFPSMVAVAWPGGTGGIMHVDWAPLAGRNVVLWPDNDDPGRKAMDSVGESLERQGCTVRLVDTRGIEQPKGWDISDAVSGWVGANGEAVAGWTRQEVVDWAKTRIVGWTKPEAVPDAVSEESGNQPAPPREVETPAEPPETGGNGGGEQNPIPPRGGRSRRAKPQLATIDGNVVLAPPAPAEPQTDPSPSVAAHLKAKDLGLSTTKAGDPHCNEFNVIQVLTKHPDFAGHIWFDEFYQEVYTDIGGGEPRQWTDKNGLRLLSLLQGTFGMPKLAMRHIENAVRSVAFAHSRHAVRDWLNGLVWDGTPRLDTFMSDAFGTIQSAYTAAVGRCWLMSMVARAMWPGCQADYMPVLEGLEGKKKTTALYALAGGWFAECHAEMSGKSFQEHLAGGVWLLELSELSGLQTARSIEAVKGLVSCRVDRFRASYARTVTSHPRQVILCGTTNRDDWNASDTGARRFWPVRATGVNIDYIRANRDQLFAEAVTLFKKYPAEDSYAAAREANGAAWWDVPAEDAEREQEAREDEDSIADAIFPWLRQERKVRITAYEIMTQCLSMKATDCTPAFQRRIGRILRRAKWVNTPRHNPVTRRTQRMWTAPTGFLTVDLDANNRTEDDF